jgi:hypothetical protein
MLRIVMCASVCLLLGVSVISAKEPTVADYTTFWRPIVGSWKMTNDADGKITTGTFKFRISPNKKCVLLYHGEKGEPFMQQLQGYDPVAKKLLAFGFSENGNFQIQTICIDGMAKGKKAAKGDGGNWEQKVFGTDGTTTTSTSKWKFTHLEKDKVVMEWSDIEGGEDQPKKLTMTLERAK